MELEHIGIGQGGFPIYEDEDGDVYALTADGVLMDEQGTHWYYDEDSGDLLELDEAAEEHAAALEELAQNQRALENGLGRELTEQKTMGLFETAIRTNTTDAREAFDRFNKDEGRDKPLDPSEDEDRIALMAQHADSIQEQEQEQQQEQQAQQGKGDESPAQVAEE